MIVFDINGDPLVTVHDVRSGLNRYLSGEISEGVLRVKSASDLEFYVVIETKETIGQYTYSGGWNDLGGCTIY